SDAGSLLPGLFDSAAKRLDLDKTALGVGRLIHFLALAYVVYYARLTVLMSQSRIFAPLCLMGRYSLAVFGTGAILSTVGLATMDDDWPSQWCKLGFLGAGIGLQYAMARYLRA